MVKKSIYGGSLNVSSVQMGVSDETGIVPYDPMTLVSLLHLHLRPHPRLHPRLHPCPAP
jgi:hypothetical protein